MTTDKKKIAAAMAAVFTYIKTEEEAACFAAQNGENQLTAALSGIQASGMGVKPNVWGSCGRTDLMQIRTMMQMRAFK